MATNKPDMDGLGMTNQEPEPLTEPEPSNQDEPEDHFQLEELDKKNKVYREVTIDFENAGLKVVKIEKLINIHLCKRYITERDLMLSQRLKIDPDFKLNEKYLYHGTTAKKDYICEEGLDSRMSKQGCFGKGIYFSNYPKKCVRYAEKEGGSESFILLMRVILGDSKTYPKKVKHRELVREPEKEAPYKGYRFYDSVQGCPVNHQEFVVYENRRALVEYLITYAKTEPEGQVEKEPCIKQAKEGDTQPRARPSSVSSESDLDDPADLNDTSDDEEFGVANYLRMPIDSPYLKRGEVVHDEYEPLLEEMRKKFMEATGETKEIVVDHFLLRGNLEVDDAIKMYKEKPEGVEFIIDEEEDPKVKKFEAELKRATAKPQYPEPGSDAWNSLGDSDKDAIIEGLIQDFLDVTGMEKTEHDYAKRCLASNENNLDLAILSHYEDLF
ncbi:uncharacterized protein LOC131947921 isoform X2 [Physella acuta]|uniref:uncharacterized protein LOC131947921 isoform X2 n=1 Tax=Physella acuta TaxID=109671 RepID=UPI0027DC6389|nr:uncharacterized protein LOC131947921 isoform X2 [Physella acuta]